MLAQCHVMANQRSTALRVLQEGLTDEYPGRPYLEMLFNAAEQGEDCDSVVRMCERYGPRSRTDGSVRDRPWLSARQFAALGAAGRWAEALAMAMREETGDAAGEHRVLALLALGRPTDAVAFLAE